MSIVTKIHENIVEKENERKIMKDLEAEKMSKYQKNVDAVTNASIQTIQTLINKHDINDIIEELKCVAQGYNVDWWDVHYKLLDIFKQYNIRLVIGGPGQGDITRYEIRKTLNNNRGWLNNKRGWLK